MKLILKLSLAGVLVANIAVSVAHADLVSYSKKFSNGSVTFVRDSSMDPNEFSKADYRLKPDQAYMSDFFPLKIEDHYAVSPEDFKTMTQEEIDQYYIRLSSGPIAPSQYMGSIVIRSEMIQNIRRALKNQWAMKLYNNLEKFTSKLGMCTNVVECFGQLVWGGKEIYATNPHTGVTELRNGIDPATAETITTFLGNTNQAQIAGNIRPFRSNVPIIKHVLKAMMFPAKVFCGQSFFDHRKESIIIDYAYGDDFKDKSLGTSGLNYIDNLDNLAGRGFLDVRDEIRMVRPGLYLGRAYMNKIFILNFVLYNPDADKPQTGQMPADACFNGSVTR